jgi:hypothetical protein
MSADGQDLGDPGTFALGPEAASAKLAELTAAYKGTAPETPTTAGEAKARLQVLAHDEKWYQRFTAGNLGHQRRWLRAVRQRYKSVRCTRGASLTTRRMKMSSYIGKLAECEHAQGPFATTREAQEFFAGCKGEPVVLEVRNATVAQQLVDQVEMLACLLRGSKNQVLIENEMHGLEIAFQLYREGLIDRKKQAA